MLTGTRLALSLHCEDPAMRLALAEALALVRGAERPAQSISFCFTVQSLLVQYRQVDP